MTANTTAAQSHPCSRSTKESTLQTRYLLGTLRLRLLRTDKSLLSSTACPQHQLQHDMNSYTQISNQIRQ